MGERRWEREGEKRWWGERRGGKSRGREKGKRGERRGRKKRKEKGERKRGKREKGGQIHLSHLVPQNSFEINFCVKI